MANVSWCHDCNRPEGICKCKETPPMTTITDAHRAEARRRLNDINVDVIDILAQALAEAAWTPPVDPDLVEARECAALACDAVGNHAEAAAIRDNGSDHRLIVQSALIAIKRSKA